MRKTSFGVIFLVVLTGGGLIGHAHAKPGWGTCSNCHGLPVVTDFQLVASHDSRTVPVTTFSATDGDPNNQARVNGYMLTTTAVAPAAGDPGWQSSPPGEYTFTADGLQTLFAWARDSLGSVSAAVSDTVNITVPAPDMPPMADAGPDQTVDQYGVVTLDGTNSSDPDDGIASILWEQIGGTAVAIVDADMEIASFVTPNVGTAGESLTFQLTVTDFNGAVSTDTCIVNVSWVNEPPVANAGGDQTVEAGGRITLDGSLSGDPDDGIDTYLWEQIKGTPVALSDPTAVKPIFTMGDVGRNGESLTFRLTVTDLGRLQATDTCVVNITWVNTAPVADAGRDQDAATGDDVILNGSGSNDPDGGAIQYVWTQTAGTPVTLSDPRAVQPAFTAPVLAGGSETLTFLLTVTDEGRLQATDTCEVRVSDNTQPSPRNQPPTADAGADQTVNQGVVVSLNAAGSSDPDGDPLTYLWVQMTGTGVILSDPAAANPTFIPPASGTRGDLMLFSLTVADPSGMTATDTCAVTVLAADPPPTGDDSDAADSDADSDADDDDDDDDDKKDDADEKKSECRWRKWLRWLRFW